MLCDSIKFVEDKQSHYQPGGEEGRWGSAQQETIFLPFCWKCPSHQTLTVWNISFRWPRIVICSSSNFHILRDYLTGVSWQPMMKDTISDFSDFKCDDTTPPVSSTEFWARKLVWMVIKWNLDVVQCVCLVNLTPGSRVHIKQYDLWYEIQPAASR